MRLIFVTFCLELDILIIFKPIKNNLFFGTTRYEVTSVSNEEKLSSKIYVNCFYIALILNKDSSSFSHYIPEGMIKKISHDIKKLIMSNTTIKSSQAKVTILPKIFTAREGLSVDLLSEIKNSVIRNKLYFEDGQTLNKPLEDIDYIKEEEFLLNIRKKHLSLIPVIVLTNDRPISMSEVLSPNSKNTSNTISDIVYETKITSQGMSVLGCSILTSSKGVAELCIKIDRHHSKESRI